MVPAIPDEYFRVAGLTRRLMKEARYAFRFAPRFPARLPAGFRARRRPSFPAAGASTPPGTARGGALLTAGLPPAANAFAASPQTARPHGSAKPGHPNHTTSPASSGSRKPGPGDKPAAQLAEAGGSTCPGTVELAVYGTGT